MATTTRDRVSGSVAAYLAFLGYHDRPPPTLDALIDVHRRHLDRVPYENLGIMLGRPPSVDPADSIARVARVGRAGYCFHQNGALETALVDLGFAVSRRGGHVWTSPEDRHSGVLNHLVLVASGLPTDDNPSGDWWVDVGLGDAFVDPVPLVVGPQPQGGFDYEMTEVRPDGWSFTADPLGSFSGVEVGPAPTPVDIEERHASLSTPPGQFTKVLVVQRRDRDGIDIVRGCLHQRVTPGEKAEVELTSYDQWRGAIADGCGLSLAELADDDLRALWARTLDTHRAWTEAGRP